MKFFKGERGCFGLLSLSQCIKLGIFASICVVALLPSIIIGFFQQKNLAEEEISRLALSLKTLEYRSREESLSPQLTVSLIQNSKLVLYSAYSRGGEILARSGLTPSKTILSSPLKELNPKKNLLLQLDVPSLFDSNKHHNKRFKLYLDRNWDEYVEIGVSYEPLFSLVRNIFALSLVIFFTGFVFLFGTILFIDTNISYVIEKITLALSSKDAQHALQDMHLDTTLYAKNFNKLMDELEKHEGAMVSTRDTLQSVFDSLHTGVALLSLECKVVLVNKFLTDMMGASSQEELLGQSCGSLNFNNQKAVNTCEKCSNTMTFQSLDMNLTIDGKERSFIYTVYPLKNHKGEPFALVAQYHEVTAERKAQNTLENFNKQLTEQLEVERKKLEESNQQLLQTSKMAAVGELAGGVAHEINNPNGVILAGAMYVRDKLKGDTNAPKFIDKYLERIIKQSERIDEIVSALLTFSRRKPQKKDKIDIKDSINDALELVHSRFNRFQVIYKENLAQDLPLIEGNQNELVHVFLNLFNNAVDAMGETSGRISLTAEKYRDQNYEDAIQINVHNTGENIPDNILKKVMEPFFTTKPVGKGTGLGLSISHGIVTDHGGIMRVSNHPEGGANFKIILPVTKT